VEHRDASPKAGDGPSSEPPADREAVPLSGSLRPRGPVRFAMTVGERPDAIWLELSGELDILTTPKLAAELNTIVRRSTLNVVLDLRQAVFIDSAGLQILLGTQRRLRQASRRLTVICDEGPVRRVIEMTRLDDILGLVDGAQAGER
jgi:anti-sigma B factor antagonist